MGRVFRRCEFAGLETAFLAPVPNWFHGILPATSSGQLPVQSGPLAPTTGPNHWSQVVLADSARTHQQSTVSSRAQPRGRIGPGEWRTLSLPTSKTTSPSVESLENSLSELLDRTLWDLPVDVDDAISAAMAEEEEGTNGRAALEEMTRATSLARENRCPLGNDPLSLLIYVDGPENLDRAPFIAAAEAATHAGYKSGLLRTATVDAPSGRPRRGKDLGAPPQVVFRSTEGEVKVHLLLRGVGDSELAYSSTLPHWRMAPGIPSLEGVSRLVLAAIHEGQGRSAGPGVVGIHVGSDSSTGFPLALQQLLRPVGSKNSIRAFTQLEAKVTEEANSLGIGPLGLGGKSTILAAHLSASAVPKERWTVSVVHSSWTLRRQSITLKADGSIASWDTLAKPKKKGSAERKAAAPAKESGDSKSTAAGKKKVSKSPAKKAKK